MLLLTENAYTLKVLWQLHLITNVQGYAKRYAHNTILSFSLIIIYFSSDKQYISNVEIILGLWHKDKILSFFLP